MSRIVGIVTWRSAAALETSLSEDPGSSRVLSAMLATARSQPQWKSARAAVGGAQLGWTGWKEPQIYRDGELSVVVDGCFYNAREIGSGENEAERLANSYRRRGFTSSLSRINGDFAVALFDHRTGTLWLGRDRLGAKPLYYAETAERFVFGSRPRTLFPVPGVKRDIRETYAALFAGSHYRTFDNDPDSSAYRDIRQLPAGSVLRVTADGSNQSRYWELEDLSDWTDSEEELAERYRELLLDAVKIRLAAATSPAFTLSGGMDSSSVLASAVRITGRKQNAISTVYHDKTYDESDEIRTILETTVEHWQTVQLGTPDVFGCVERMVADHDEPIATATWLSHYLLCQNAANQGFRGLFGGLGGDELNAGEYEYFFFHFADLKRAGQQTALDHEIACWVRHHDHPVFRKDAGLAGRELERIVDLHRPGVCLPDRRRIERYAAALNRDRFDVTQFTPIMDHPFSSYLKNRTLQDLLRETAPCCLRAEDRQATAFGLENFLPFFDHRLVEFMFRVPGHLKIRDGVTKRLLREAMRGILPDSTRTRIKKTGWNAPAHVWFSGDGLQPLRDMMGSQSFRERGIYDVAEVKRLLDEHEQIVTSGRPAENHMMFFWQLVNLETWLRWLTEFRLPNTEALAEEVTACSC